MKADYVHKDTLTATDYVDLQKENDLIVSYNQQLLKENQQLKIQISAREKEYLRLKNQQKEFISYLEDEIKRLEKDHIYEPLQRMAVETHKHNLSKYKEIIRSDTSE